MNLKSEFIEFLKTDSSTKYSVHDVTHESLMFYNFYFKHFSIWRIFHRIQGKIIYDTVESDICNAISFGTADLYME
jgi:hypothetical protein